TTVIHCCGAEAPVTLLRESGAHGLSLDTSLLDDAGWEQVAEASEAGVRLGAGAVPTSGAGDWRSARDRLLESRPRVGRDAAALGALVVTPACGLAQGSPSSAASPLRATRDLAAALTDLSADS